MRAIAEIVGITSGVLAIASYIARQIRRKVRLDREIAESTKREEKVR